MRYRIVSAFVALSVATTVSTACAEDYSEVAIDRLAVHETEPRDGTGIQVYEDNLRSIFDDAGWPYDSFECRQTWCVIKGEISPDVRDKFERDRVWRGIIDGIQGVIGNHTMKSEGSNEAPYGYLIMVRQLSDAELYEHEYSTKE